MALLFLFHDVSKIKLGISPKNFEENVMTCQSELQNSRERFDRKPLLRRWWTVIANNWCTL